MSRSTYVQRTTRRTIESVRSFKETIDALHTEINFFYPIHSDEMVEKAVAANSAAMFDEQIVAAQAGLKLGYLPFGDHRAHRFLNVYNPKRKILESHAYGIGAPTKAYSMTKHVQESAINFPLRIMVLERPDGRANIVYDLPSTQIPKQDQIPALKAACAFVDEKIEQLIRYVSGPLPMAKAEPMEEDEAVHKVAEQLVNNGSMKQLMDYVTGPVAKKGMEPPSVAESLASIASSLAKIAESLAKVTADRR